MSRAAPVALDPPAFRSDQGGGPAGCALLITRHGVRVNGQGDGRAGVAEPLADHVHRLTGPQQDRRVRVPQVMVMPNSYLGFSRLIMLFWQVRAITDASVMGRLWRLLAQ
jgi:hypothetical protein